MANIARARKVFLKEGSYFYFIANYNIYNRHSILGYLPGMHDDIFNCETESMENKELLSLLDQAGYGRGGSRHGKCFVFGILDWSYQSRTRRQWLTANLGRCNVNPHARWGSNEVDERMPMSMLVELRGHVTEQVAARERALSVRRGVSGRSGNQAAM